MERGKPHVLVLGGNLSGLTAARLIREQCGREVSMTLIDRKPYLVFIPNIPIEVMANRDPEDSMHLPIHRILSEDGIDFIQADVTEIDLENRRVTFVPSERLGAAPGQIRYDYLVLALGARLAYDRIEGFGSYGRTLSDSYYGDKLRIYLHEGGYRGGPIAIGSARFHQGDRGRPDWLPTSQSACEGPPLEIALALATWLQDRHLGGPQTITLFTPAEVIAEDAGEEIVQAFLGMMEEMGHHRAFYVHSNTWYGGDISIFRMGYLYYAMKIAFKEMYFHTGGKPPSWGIPLTELLAEHHMAGKGA